MHVRNFLPRACKIEWRVERERGRDGERETLEIGRRERESVRVERIGERGNNFLSLTTQL